MGRAKLPIKLITREKNRNITFKKRRNGLKKKIYEFATLCDVKAAMICFGPDGQQFDTVTWPEEPQNVEAIIGDYRRRSVEEQRKRNSDVLGYLMDRKKKAEEEVLHRQRENANLLYPSWEKELDNCSEDFLRQLASNLNYTLEMVQKQIEEVEGKQIVDIEDQIDIMLSEPQHTDCTNYLLDMNKRLDIMDAPQLQPMPISSLKPPFDLHSELRYPSMICDTNILSNAPNYDFLNLDGINSNFSTPQSFSSPGYTMFETKEYLFYKKDYDLGTVQAGSTNNKTFSLFGGSSSSSSSSHGHMVPQPGFMTQNMTGLNQSVSEFQPPGSQLTDLFWQFSSGGNH
ncbi:floral homeotic protein AGAMOUS-like [Aristolochia californica]|uniref:floral homeotic protein AGAMOUS-like n=1 Tax=Aristolochia californica TaxID=171875 RepID=UPI0035DC5659